jgi:hypothetical protein
MATKKRILIRRAACMRFRPEVSMREVEGTLKLARLACESLYGARRVKRETRTDVDHVQGACRIETAGVVGRTLFSIFDAYLRREFGSQAFATKNAPNNRGHRPQKKRFGESNQ